MLVLCVKFFFINTHGRANRIERISLWLDAINCPIIINRCVRRAISKSRISNRMRCKIFVFLIFANSVKRIFNNGV